MTSADQADERPRIPGQALRLLPFFLVLLVGLSIWRLGDSRPTNDLNSGTQWTTASGQTMGTTFTVKVIGRLPPAREAAMKEAVSTALHAVDTAMSTYRPESALSLFNQSQAKAGPVPVSPELRTVLSIAFDVSSKSKGAFDITVGPLVELWGFGPGDGHGHAEPAQSRLDTLMQQVGMHRLSLGREGLTKTHDALHCDLSAIAKGHAVDRVAGALDALHLNNYLIEVGGELRARGHKPGGIAFRVGIEEPNESGRAVTKVVNLHNMGMATSGDYRNFVEKNGRKLSHIIDPRTGRPVTHALTSVTVLAKTAAEADAWATALTVLGPTQGPLIAARHGVAAFFIVREDGERFRSQQTTAFSRLQDNTPP